MFCYFPPSPQKSQSQRGVSHRGQSTRAVSQRAGSPSTRLPPSGSLAEISKYIINFVLQASIWIMLSGQMHSFFCLSYFFFPSYFFCLLHQAPWYAVHLSHKSAFGLPAWAAEPQKTETLHHFSPCPSFHPLSSRVTILYLQWLQRLQDKPDWQVCLSRASKPPEVGVSLSPPPPASVTHPRQRGELTFQNLASHWCLWWFLAPRRDT